MKGSLPKRLICVGLASALPLGSAEAARARGKFPPSLHSAAQAAKTDELIVTYRESMSENQKQNTVHSAGGRILRRLHVGHGGAHRIQVAAGDLENSLKLLQQDPAVLHVQKNFIYHATALPNDPGFSQLWGLKNTGQTITASGSYADTPLSTANPGTSGKDLGLASAWDIRTSCAGVVVAVIDTGVNLAHTDLAANLWTNGSYPNHGYDFVDSDNNPTDLNGHGTHVAGTIGAVGNNGVLGTGVCWQAEIMAVRVLDASGAGTTADIVDGVDFAVAQGAKVINMSLGGPSSGASQDQLFSDAIQNAADAGVLVVVAAGNDGANVDTSGQETYPCSYPHANLICVAALDQVYGLASFSNRGVTSVDVAAPGVNIVSDWAGTATSIADDFNTSGTIDWTTSSTTATGWGYLHRTLTAFGSSALSLLTVPRTYDGSAVRYANSTDDRAYKAFTFSSALSILADFYAVVDTATNDYFNIQYRIGSASPFGSGGTQLDHLTGTTQGEAEHFAYDVTACASQTCTFGFQLTTDSSGVRPGVAIGLFSFEALTTNTAAQNVISGTSMASPHVAGVAALVWAQNPNYTWSEVKDALLNSGLSLSVLSGKTVTSRAVDAAAAIRYLRAPTSLSVTLDP